MGRGQGAPRPNLPGATTAAIPVDEALYEQVRRAHASGSPGRLPALRELHDLLDALLATIADAEVAALIVRPDAAVLSAADEDEHRRVIASCAALSARIKEALRQVGAGVDQLAAVEFDLDQHARARRHEVERREAARAEAAAEAAQRAVLPLLADRYTLTDLVSGKIPLPDTFPLSAVPLYSSTGAPLTISWSVGPRGSPGAVVSTLPELLAACRAGGMLALAYSGHGKPGYVNVVYRSGTAREVPPQKVLIPRRTLAERIASHAAQPATAP